MDDSFSEPLPGFSGAATRDAHMLMSPGTGWHEEALLLVLLRAPCSVLGAPRARDGRGRLVRRARCLLGSKPCWASIPPTGTQDDGLGLDRLAAARARAFAVANSL